MITLNGYVSRFPNFKYLYTDEPELIEAFEDYLDKNAKELFSSVSFNSHQMTVGWQDLRSLISVTTDNKTNRKKYEPKLKENEKGDITLSSNGQAISDFANRQTLLNFSTNVKVNGNNSNYSDIHKARIFEVMIKKSKRFTDLMTRLRSFNRHAEISEFHYNKVWYGVYKQQAVGL